MRIFLFIILTISLSAGTFGQQILTLEESIKIALNRNPDLRKTQNNLETFESGLTAAYGNFLPSLSANGGWSWNRSEDEGSTFNFNGIVITTPPSVTESRSYNASINSSLTLFDGLANFAALSQSQDDLEAARLGLERVKQDIVFQTIALFYNVINTQKLLVVNEDNVKWNQKNLETIQERNRLGAVTLADVYAQQVRFGNAELEIIRTQNNLETAKAELLYFLGLDVLGDYTFTDPSEERDFSETGLSEDFVRISELVDQALDTRPDYKSAILNLESAYSGVTIARSGHLPRLTGNASFSSFANTFDNLFKNKNWSVGLTLSIPIFSGFAIDNQVQIADVFAKNVEIDLSNLERNIKRNIQQTFLDLQAAEKGLEVSRRNVIAAEENRKIEQEKYSLGSGTLLNVLIANSEFTTAQTNFINAQFEYIVLSNQLKYYLGTLDYKQYE